MLAGEKPTVRKSAYTYRKIVYEYRNDLQCSILVGGWDENEGGQIYALPLGGAIFRQPFTASGSGSIFAMGYLDVTFKTRMAKEDCREMVKTAIALASHRDASSGGVIRLATITKDGVEISHFSRGKDGEIPEFLSATDVKPEFTVLN